MLFDKRKINYTLIFSVFILILLFVHACFFIFDSIKIVSQTNINNFTFNMRVRDSVEQLSKIFSSAETNATILARTIESSYKDELLYDKAYNYKYLRGVSYLIKNLLASSPGSEGFWFQLNANLPFSNDGYLWYAKRNGKVVDIKQTFDADDEPRILTPENDPYYFKAIKTHDFYWSDVYTDIDTQVEMITLSRAVYKNKKLIGVIGVDISMESLDKAMSAVQMTFKDSEVFIFNKKGAFIASKHLPDEENTFDHDEQMKKMLAEYHGKSMKVMEYSDHGVKSTATLLKLTDKYTLIMSFPSRLIYEGFNRLFNTVYIIVTLIFILGVLAVYSRLKIVKINKILEKETNTLKSVINSSPTMIIIKDLQGRYLDCNKEFLKMVGKKKEEVIGKTNYELFNKALSDAIAENDNLVIKTKTPMIDEYWHTYADGSKILLEKYRIPLFDADNNLIGILVNAVDITKERQEQHTLKKAKDVAEKATKMKSNFLANMSHEIRTPMNGVIGFLQLLDESDATQEQKEYIKNARKASEILLNIINEILDFSKIEAGKLQLDSVSFDIRSLVEDVSKMGISSIKHKNVDINLLICSDVYEKVIGDPGRIRQILNNLIGNAIKFTQSGEINICVSQESQIDEKVNLEFRIKDTGIGIAEDKLGLIFETFTQADSSTTRRYGGTGLGLAISNELARLMGGSISVESKEGEGSVFTLKIPLLKDKNCNILPIDGVAKIKNSNILIVDEMTTALNVVNYYLEEAGCNVFSAHSIEETLIILNDNKIDIIIIGYSKIDIADILNQKYSNSIPTILYANLSVIGDALEAKEHGFFGYLSKPVSKNDLIKIVAMALSPESRDLKNELMTKHTLKEHKFNSKSKVLVVEDSELNSILITKILQNAGLNCDLATDGSKAVEAVKNKKYDLILMDCQMPIMDGYEATREIRKIENQQYHTPIVAITANAFKADEQKCLEAGMDDYISKPINIEKLMIIMKKYIELLPDEADDGSSIENADKLNLIDKIKLELVDEIGLGIEDTDVLLNKFFEYLPDAIDEIKIAFSENDFENLTRLAHKFKGASANLRFQSIAILAAKLEEGSRSYLTEECEVLISELEFEIGRILSLIKNDQ